MSNKPKQILRGSVNAGSVLKGNTNVGSVLKGKDGITFIPAIDADGNLFWTNDGGLENPPIINLKKDEVSPEEIQAAVNEYLDNNPVEGGAKFETDNTLKLEDGVLSVNTTNQMEQDNTLPITSAGVYATVGNIEALLKTI